MIDYNKLAKIFAKHYYSEITSFSTEPTAVIFSLSASLYNAALCQDEPFFQETQVDLITRTLAVAGYLDWTYLNDGVASKTSISLSNCIQSSILLGQILSAYRHDKIESINTLYSKLLDEMLFSEAYCRKLWQNRAGSISNKQLQQDLLNELQ